MTETDLKNKNVAIVGFGVEGESVLSFLQKYTKNITIFDRKTFSELDSHLQEIINKGKVKFVPDENADLTSFDIIFRSPGIHPKRSNLEKAKEKGILITSAVKVFFDLCPCPIIGVTGTKGKGTTSSLIYEMLKEEGFNTYLGGNIGTPPLVFLDTLTPKSRVVLEISSFQLMDTNKSPHIGVILMTTSEHLDYHKNVYEYIDAKRNIFRFQGPGDYAIVNRDYPASNESDIVSHGKVYKVSREQEVDQGCYVENGSIYLKINEKKEKVIDTKEILLPGKHNLENVCAAVVAGIFGGAKMKAIIHVLKTFKGLEHRLELIRTVNGVRYYDDSFSTTPETAIAAIEAFEAPEILILGGSSKNSDFTELGRVIRDSKNIKAIVVGGTEWIRIKEKIDKHALSKITVVEGSKNMHEIIENASKVATLGDVVLLSPACASFDMFKNYKDRGEQFKAAVNDLV